MVGSDILKILHVIINLGSGGAEKLLEEAVPLMNEIEGVETDVLLLTDEKNVFDKALKSKGIKVDVIKLRKIYSPVNIIEIRKHIVDGKYDIVHSHLFPTQYWVALSRLFLKSKKIKLITTEHSTNNRRRGKPYFRLLDKYIYSKYDSIISITDKTQNNLINWIDPKRKQLEKHRVIENGINLDKFANAIPYNKHELKKEFNEKTKLICMVGRFSEAKDQPTLIKAITKLPPDIHLLLVGEGPLRRYNEDLAQQLGVIHRVHFLGFRNDVERILKTADIIVLSSHWEGLSLASIEGMSCGRPFLASKVEGLQEIVEGYGMIFEHENENELSILIKKILDEDDIYNEIVINCLKRAEEFNISTTVQKLIDEYNTLLK